MALGLTNINVSEVKALLNEGFTDVYTLCQSNNINQWSERKPAYYGADKDTWTDTPPVALHRNQGTEAHRLGDFRGYNHYAKPPLTFFDTEYNLDRYMDISGAGGSSTPTVVVGEMYFMLNNDGFNPDYVADQEDVILSPELWNGGSLKYTASGTTVVRSEIINDAVQLKVINPTELQCPAGTYTLKCKIDDRITTGHIQEELSFVIANKTYYKYVPNSFTYNNVTNYVKLNGSLDLDAGGSGAGSRNLTITFTITQGAGSDLYWKTGGLVKSGNISHTIGVDNETANWQTIGDPVSGDSIAYTVVLTETSYEYESGLINF